MIKYLQNTLDGFTGKTGKSAATPAAENLFKLRDLSEAEYLSEERAQQFRRVAAQLLFLSARARRDIQIVVAFLTTRV